VPPVRVREVATFYTMYRLRPVGRHHIGVCNSISCWAMGAEQIIHHCAEKLGIRPGETTSDGHFSLEEVACLASCGTAPAALVNNFTFVERVTADSMSGLIDDLRAKPGQHMAKGPQPRLPDPRLHVDAPRLRAPPAAGEAVGSESQATPQATGSLGEPAVTTAPERGTTERKP
jgi:2Fe-2S thioredoxin-like protein